MALSQYSPSSATFCFGSNLFCKEICVYIRPFCPGLRLGFDHINQQQTQVIKKVL